MSNLNLGFRTVGNLTMPAHVPDYQFYWNIFRFGWVPRYWQRVLGERKNAVELGLMHPSDAILCWARELFDKRDFEIQAWSSRMLQAFADEHAEICCIGPASSGKSEALGVYLLGMWGLTPKTSTCLLVSTTVPQLRRRSFGACAKYHAILKKRGMPGIYSRQFTMIVNEDEFQEGVSSTDIKSGIIGIASEGGKGAEEAASRIGGIHQSTTAEAKNAGEGGIIVVIDECQSIPEGIFRASVNLRSGADYFKILSAGNIFHTSGNSLADRAEPRASWSSIDMDSEQWDNVRDNSITIRFDGTKSPAVVEPNGEDRYPYLIGPSHIRNILAEVKNQESDAYYLSMVRSWPSDAEATSVVLPVTMQSRFRCREPAEWLTGKPDRKFMGIDPAWSAGGDAAVAQILHTGLMRDGVYGIEVQPPVYLKIDAQSKVPVQYQLSNQIVALMKLHDIRLSDVGSDESASQLLLDVVLMESGQTDPIRVNFSARATDRAVSTLSDQKANQRYANMITELWYLIEQYASFGHIRGLSGPAAHQLASRQIVPDKRPIRLEKKSDYKARLRAGSPDEADALAVAVHVVAERLGLVPGATVHNPYGVPARFVKRSNSVPSDYLQSDYSQQENYS